MIRKHIDFDVWIGLDEVKAKCGGKEARAEIQLAPFEKEMEELARALQQSPEISGSKLGKRLYDAVFVKQVRDLMAVNLPQRGSKRGLRVRLRLHRKVSGWLWELLNTGSSFLAMSIKTPVVRDLDGNPFPVRHTAWPIRVLAVVPSPAGPAPLDADQELTDIRKALGWRETLGLVKLERLDPPTLSELKVRLDNRQYHVLHFIGHGTFLRDRGQGALLFEDADGNADPVEGERLAAVLDDDESLRLVILNACDSAHGTGEDLFAGVAQSLAQKRIPAVVGMQYPIYDDMAVAFSRRFYHSALVRRRPVDWALSRGRQAMHAARPGLDWTIPVLFLSAPDGKLFPWKPSRGLYAAFVIILVMLSACGVWYSKTMAPERIPPAPPIPAASMCPSPKDMKMEFVRIPAGNFMMGSDGGEDDEKPRHKVTISRPFCLSAREVTQQQWREIVEPNTVHSKSREDKLPVSGVSWEEAQEFIERLNVREGRRVYRLPTEAEWEYAARGPHKLPGGNCLHGDGFDGLAPAGSFRTNDWYLYDMYGNVWEWVADWYGSYEAGPLTDPAGPSTGTKRVKRGGSYSSASKHCRPARRSSQKPDGHHKDVGLRILRELDLAPKITPEANLSR
ncbi:MAG TPA: SUMF1/EgtB/PvdO family nonheme iron enzyme [Thermoanaerobaculia bacterium]|jgi:formylglycine-generating enzyme required for sulfatase activity|nr:SUMF1/EgtB/PvdO family nonheme iron enzyme [Thermoanaerobaculia bacterium]